MSPYGFVNCDKCTTLIEDVNNRGNWGWDMWELYTTFSETVLKLKVYLKNIKQRNLAIYQVDSINIKRRILSDFKTQYPEDRLNTQRHLRLSLVLVTMLVFDI